MEEDHLLRCPFNAEAGRWVTYADARAEHEQILVYSVLELPCPPTRLAPMAEFLERANFGLIVGNFELDWSDGETRCKTYIDLRGVPVPDATLHALAANVVETNLRVVYRYLPGVVAVMSGASPVDQIAAIEK